MGLYTKDKIKHSRYESWVVPKNIAIQMSNDIRVKYRKP